MELKIKCKPENLIKQGAEAKIYVVPFLNTRAIVKERFTKTYRHPDLDAQLLKERMKAEVKGIYRCAKAGIQTPAIYLVDKQNQMIVMEYIENSITVTDYITSMMGERKVLEDLCCEIGKVIQKMHHGNIVHGDLTTSNMLVKNFKRGTKQICLIDFGLSHFKSTNEDKAVDLYVLERAFLSTFPNFDFLFNHVLLSYASGGTSSKQVIRKLSDVRARGRKKSMAG